MTGKWGLRPPFQNPPLARDVRGASGAALRDCGRRGRTREDQLTCSAEPLRTATLGPLEKEVAQ
jgi:hypothetical protein